MLNRIGQLLFGKRVAPSVEEEVFHQNEDLQRIKREIATIEGQLNDSMEALSSIQNREEILRADIEAIVMEIHDPMLIREEQLGAQEGSDGGHHVDATVAWEHKPFDLRDANATFSRIRDVIAITSSDDDEGFDPSKPNMPEHGKPRAGDVGRRDNTRQDQKRSNKKRLPFVVLSEHSDVDDARSSSDDEVQQQDEATENDRLTNPDAVAVKIRDAAVSDPTDAKELAEASALRETVVMHWSKLVESDFVSPAEWRRWRLFESRIQQTNLVEQHFRGKVLKDAVSRREDLEGKIFARRCDLIHLKAFEENAEQQLRSSGVRMLDRDQMLMISGRGTRAVEGGLQSESVSGGVTVVLQPPPHQ